MSLNDIIEVQASAGVARPARAGFGTLMIVAYHKHWSGRSRTYTGDAGAITDGFSTLEPAYKQLVAAFSQTPRPKTVKIGRRANAPEQVVNMTPVAPSAGTLYQADLDGVTREYTADGADSLADVCTEFAAACNGAEAADVDAIIATGASTNGVQALDEEDFDGVIGGEVMDPPRRVSFTFSSHSDWDATVITVTGKDEDGVTITETIAVPNNGNDIVNGAYRFSQITGVSIPAQTAGGGTFTMGVIAVTTVAQPDAIIRRGASTAGIQTLADDDFNGTIGAEEFDRPSSVQFTFNEHADWDATTIVVSGKDEAGNDTTENFSVSNGGNNVVTGAVIFTQITEVSIPAQTGTNGTFTMGLNPRYTASGASGTKVVVTATDDGQLVSFENWYDHSEQGATLSVEDVTEDPGIAEDLAAIRLADPDWYGLVLDSTSKAEVEEATAWGEAQRLLGAYQSGDSGITDADESEDLFSALKLSGYTRAVPIFHPSIAAQFIAAGALAGRLARDPGSYTWKFKRVPGVESYTLNETERGAVLAKKGNIYTPTADIAIIEDGTVSSGSFADITRFIDWQVAQIQEGIYFLFLNNEKIPYTDAGIAMVVAVIYAKLKAGIRQGGLREDPFPVVTAPLVADIDPQDRADRVVPDIVIDGQLAGAIHKVRIRMAVSV